MRPQCCECVGALDRSPRSRGWTCIRARVLRRRGAQISDLPISPLSVLPSTRITVSALRTGISALDSPARMPRYRRFTDRLATACARLAVRHGRPALCQRDFHPRPYSSLPGCSTLYDLSSPIWMGMEQGVQEGEERETFDPNSGPRMRPVDRGRSRIRATSPRLRPPRSCRSGHPRGIAYATSLPRVVCRGSYRA